MRVELIQLRDDDLEFDTRRRVEVGFHGRAKEGQCSLSTTNIDIDSAKSLMDVKLSGGRR